MVINTSNQDLRLLPLLRALRALRVPRVTSMKRVNCLRMRETFTNCLTIKGTLAILTTMSCHINLTNKPIWVATDTGQGSHLPPLLRLLRLHLRHKNRMNCRGTVLRQLLPNPRKGHKQDIVEWTQKYPYTSVWREGFRTGLAILARPIIFDKDGKVLANISY